MRKLTYIIFSLSFLKDIICSDFDLTVDVSPGKQDCFWHNFPQTIDVEIDYQVIDGGDMDINVAVFGPDNRVYHVDQRKQENTIKFQTIGAGDYKFCFDNTFSTYSNKIVYFGVFVEDGKDDDDLDDKLTFDGEDVQEMLDMTVEDFKGILDRAKKNLERSVQVQTLIRIHEAKDRNTQEANFWRVNVFSTFQLGVMVTVAAIQVAMIRKLFQDKKPMSGTSIKAST